MNPHEKVSARDRDHLLELIEEIFENEGKSCDLNFIAVSQVTDMHDLFAVQNFRGNISKWDVSNVTDMSGMFYGNGAILNLDTGKEEERIPFDLGIGNWDVSNVTNMSHMFSGSNFNGDISRWNVSKVEKMACMFDESLFNEDISNWNVSNVQNMMGTFRKSRFTGDISHWDVSNVRDMREMFCCALFNGDISSWDVSNVTEMDRMFDVSALEKAGKLPAWYKDFKG